MHETRPEADSPETIAKLFVDVREGDRLTLTYETPNGDERTVEAEAATDAAITERAEDDPAKGNVAFWYRDLDRGDGDGVPFATVRYRPVYGGSGPSIRVHGHTPSTEATAAMEYLGDVIRAAVDSQEAER